MSSQITIQVLERDTTLNPRQLRQAGYIPATVYGNGTAESQSIQVPAKAFRDVYHRKIETVELTGFISAVAEVKKLQVSPVQRQVLSIEFAILDEAGKAKPKAEKQEKSAVKQEKPTPKAEPVDNPSDTEASQAETPQEDEAETVLSAS